MRVPPTYRRRKVSLPQVDGALTYGEYELGHFCALIERACADRPGGLEGATLLDCGSGCGRLVGSGVTRLESLGNRGFTRLE